MNEMKVYKGEKSIHGVIKADNTRDIIPLPDYKEYYVKHALAMDTKEDIRILFSNVQMGKRFFNNASLWMNWKFCKQLAIFLWMKVLEHEEKEGEINIEDEVALNNIIRVINYSNKIKVSDIEEKLRKMEKLYENVSFKCDNEKCNKINLVKIPKDQLTMKKGTFSFICQYCNSEIKAEYNPKKIKETNSK